MIYNVHGCILHILYYDTTEYSIFDICKPASGNYRSWTRPASNWASQKANIWNDAKYIFDLFVYIIWFYCTAYELHIIRRACPASKYEDKRVSEEEIYHEYCKKLKRGVAPTTVLILRRGSDRAVILAQWPCPLYPGNLLLSAFYRFLTKCTAMQCFSRERTDNSAKCFYV